MIEDNPGGRRSEAPAAKADDTTPDAGPGPIAPRGGLAGDGAIPGYRVLGTIGEGGMAVVYEAEQVQPRRRVALKVIRNALPSDTLTKRFEVEAHVLARMNHDGIARVYASDFTSDPAYIAMELVPDAQPLDEYVRDRGLDLRARIALLAEVCDAVHHAHLNGIVHRDLKPANILVTKDGQPKVLDFGIARVLDHDTVQEGRVTTVGSLIGTPAYMSPEQASANRDAIDARTDVYALGVILYELIADHSPYAAQTMVQMLIAIAQGRVQPLTHPQSGRSVPSDLAAIVATAMAREPQRRYASVAAMADDLRRFLGHRPVTARAPSIWYQIAKLVRRHPLTAALVIGSFVVLVAAVVIVSWLYAEVDEARAVAEDNAAAAERAAEELRLTNADLIITSARSLLTYDPTQALERLARLPASELLPAAVAARARAVSWDASSRGVAQSMFDGHRAEVRWVEGAPDGSFVATAAYDDGVRVFERDGSLRWVAARPLHRPAFARISPDGSLVVSGGRDGVLRVWSARDGAELATAAAHQGKVQSGAFSADGRRFATGGEDGALRLWDPADGWSGRVLVRDGGVVERVAYSGDAAVAPVLAAALASGGVRLWDEADGRGELILTTDGGAPVERVAVSANGRRVAAGSGDGEVRVWDRDAATTRVVARHEGDVKGVVFLGDDVIVSAGRDGAVIRSALAEARSERLLEGGPTIRALTVDRAGRLVAAAGDERVARVWDAYGVTVATLRGHEGEIRALGFVDEALVSASNDGTARLWSVHGFARRPLGSPGRSAAWLAEPGPEAAFISGTEDGDVWLHGMRPGARRRLHRFAAPVHDVAVVSGAPAGGAAMAAAAWDGEVVLWDAGGASLGVRRWEQHIERLALEPRGVWLAAAADMPGIGLWRLGADGGFAILTGHRAAVEHVVVTGGGTLWSGAEDGELRRWSQVGAGAADSVVVHRGEGPVRSLVAAGEHVVAGWESGEVAAYSDGDVAAAARSLLYRRLPAAALAVAVSADGAWVAAGDTNGRIAVWRKSAGDGAAERVLDEHRGPVMSLAWLPAGADGVPRLASGGSDRYLCAWDVERRECLAVRAWEGPLTRLAIDPAGRWLAVVADEPWVQLWPAAP